MTSTFDTRRAAWLWSQQQERAPIGRIYCLVFHDFIKVGGTKSIKYRFDDLLNGAFAEYRFHCAIAGPLNSGWKRLEREVHAALKPFGVIPKNYSIKARECYERNADVERTLTLWMECGYQAELLNELNGLALLKDKKAETYRNPMSTQSKIARKVITTISLPPHIHEAALEQAAKQNRSFSNYIQSLIIQDAKNAETGAAA